jgi:hypothetical protein
MASTPGANIEGLVMLAVFTDAKRNGHNVDCEDNPDRKRNGANTDAERNSTERNSTALAWVLSMSTGQQVGGIGLRRMLLYIMLCIMSNCTAVRQECTAKHTAAYPGSSLHSSMAMASPSVTSMRSV